MTDKKGIFYAFGAYFIWGLFPLYWKLIKQVPAVQLLGHRIIWSFVVLLILLSAGRKWPGLRAPLTDRNVLGTYFRAAILIGFNWFVYVWAVNSGYVVEASLGYFINPLLSVLLGVIFFREHLRPFQWIPIGMATAGSPAMLASSEKANEAA
jgi:chloramphenicol-sensitive protein RarD